jgi:hypothetical protein
VRTKFLILFINMSGYGRRRKTTTGGRRKRHVGAALYGHGPLYGYGPLISGGKVNEWREFIKANRGTFSSLRELAQRYHASKGAGYI